MRVNVHNRTCNSIISLGISWGTISVGIFIEGSSYGIIGIIPPKNGGEVALSGFAHRFQLSRARHDAHVAWEQTSKQAATQSSLPW